MSAPVIHVLTSRWGDQSPGRRHGLLAAHPIKSQVQERVEVNCAIGSLIRDFQWELASLKL